MTSTTPATDPADPATDTVTGSGSGSEVEALGLAVRADPGRAAVRHHRPGQLLRRHLAAHDGLRPRGQHRHRRLGDQPLRVVPGGDHPGLRPDLRPGRRPDPPARRGRPDGDGRGRGITGSELRAAARGPHRPGRRRRSGADAGRGDRLRPLRRGPTPTRTRPGRRVRGGRVLPGTAGRRVGRGAHRLAGRRGAAGARPGARAVPLPRDAHARHRRPPRPGRRGAGRADRRRRRAPRAVAVDRGRRRRGGSRPGGPRRARRWWPGCGTVPTDSSRSR